ncbi:MAG: SRPBCC family protein [Saprospiraceae bacterium]|nr:SRPBCC family protein [Saprospiraceae bacterium]
MKTALRILLGIIILIVVVFIIAGLMGDKTYDVNRSVQIEAPPEVVFPFVVNLKKHSDWSPWAKRDTSMTNEYVGNMGEVGSIHKWEGDISGVGEQEITVIEPYKRVETELRFYEPWEDEADAYIDLEPNQRGTEVTWGFSGENSFMQRAMFTLMGMDLDEAVGKDYEEGLSSLKSLAEESYEQIKAAKLAEEKEEMLEESLDEGGNDTSSDN